MTVLAFADSQLVNAMLARESGFCAGSSSLMDPRLSSEDDQLGHTDCRSNPEIAICLRHLNPSGPRNPELFKFGQFLQYHLWKALSWCNAAQGPGWLTASQTRPSSTDSGDNGRHACTISEIQKRKTTVCAFWKSCNLSVIGMLCHSP